MTKYRGNKELGENPWVISLPDWWMHAIGAKPKVHQDNGYWWCRTKTPRGWELSRHAQWCEAIAQALWPI